MQKNNLGEKGSYFLIKLNNLKKQKYLKSSSFWPYNSMVIK